MSTQNNLKEYETPKFECVRQDESNKVFFTASGAPGPAPTSTSASLNGITGW